MHDKREILFEKLRGTELENLEKKKDYCWYWSFGNGKVNAHSSMDQQIEK
jgi:hypothetical protein